MPRRARQLPQVLAAPAPPPPAAVGHQQKGADGAAKVFAKTKMCKFNLLNACARGVHCAFAHDRLELRPLPDLARTKFCSAFIETGVCEDAKCRYAHSKDEFRGRKRLETVLGGHFAPSGRPGIAPTAALPTHRPVLVLEATVTAASPQRQKEAFDSDDEMFFAGREEFKRQISSESTQSGWSPSDVAWSRLTSEESAEELSHKAEDCSPEGSVSDVSSPFTQATPDGETFESDDEMFFAPREQFMRQVSLESARSGWSQSDGAQSRFMGVESAEEPIHQAEDCTPEDSLSSFSGPAVQTAPDGETFESDDEMFFAPREQFMRQISA